MHDLLQIIRLMQKPVRSRADPLTRLHGGQGEESQLETMNSVWNKKKKGRDPTFSLHLLEFAALEQTSCRKSTYSEALAEFRGTKVANH